MTFYTFNTQHGAIGKLKTLEGTALVNHKTVAVGPSFNNDPPPVAFATDDYVEWIAEARRRRILSYEGLSDLEKMPFGWYHWDEAGELRAAGEAWWTFRAYNTAPQYGFGTDEQAMQYVDHLNKDRDVNCWGVRLSTQAEIDDAHLEDTHGNTEAFSLDDALREIDNG